MFKSASTSQFQNTPFNSSLFSSVNSTLYQSKSPVPSRSKKIAVKFEIEKDKQNTIQNENSYLKPDYQRKDKYTKTCTHHLIPHQEDNYQGEPALKQIKAQKTNLGTQFKSGFLGSSSKNIQNLCDNNGYGYDSKKYSQSKKFIQQPTKFQRSYKQCRSMKTLPSYSPQEDQQFSGQKIKKQRKYAKMQAYNQLLKSSEDLVQKYKKIQIQKSRLKTDLKNQIQSNSKSSKKITFLQQEQSSSASKKYQQQHITSTPFYTPYQAKSPKYGDYSSNSIINLSKYDKYDSYQIKYDTSKYDTTSKSGLNKTSYTSNLNKTFAGSTKSYLTESYSSTTTKIQANTYSGSGGFGLSKSVASSKKISLSGVSLADFELGSCLGSGAFGQVFPARHKKSNWLFAMKKVKKQKVKYMLDQFIQQIKIQLFLDHPNVVKLYSFFDDQLHFYIIMQYMQGGSLFSYLKKQKQLSLQQTSQKLKQVCQGLKHMHDNSILHRDIKPQNIVMSHNVAKLCDFGWSAICKDRRTTYCGTLDYVSPQIIQGDGYDDSVDIWCIGVLAYQLLVGKTPFYNISRKETMKKILDCNLEYPVSMPQVAVKFVKKILRKNPDQRQNIDEILNDPLLKIAVNKTTKIF